MLRFSLKGWAQRAKQMFVKLFRLSKAAFQKFTSSFTIFLLLSRLENLDRVDFKLSMRIKKTWGEHFSKNIKGQHFYLENSFQSFCRLYF